MISRIRNNLTYSNVIASLALFAALTGVAVAAGVPKNSVGNNQLKNGAVSTKKLHREAVTNHKLGAGAVTGGKIAGGAVTNTKLGNGSVSSSKLGTDSVTASAIKNAVVNAGKLANNAVTTSKIANGAVTPAKLSSEFGPLLGTLKSGQTVRGVFELGGDVKVTRSSQTFQFPLTNAPAFAGNLLPKGATSGACPGIGGGNTATPEAAAGQLCVYVTDESGLGGIEFAEGGVNRLGFGLRAGFTAPEAGNFVRGQWAVTAP